MEEAFANSVRYNTPMSVLIIDLDHFKQINDRFGHQVGDQALIAVARCMHNMLRDTDRLGRYGGEEFVVLLPHTAMEDALTTAEKLRASIMNLEVPEITDERITISVGVAGYPNTGIDSIDDLIQQADQALYDAKNDGRNRVAVAASADNAT